MPVYISSYVSLSICLSPCEQKDVSVLSILIFVRHYLSVCLSVFVLPETRHVRVKDHTSAATRHGVAQKGHRDLRRPAPAHHRQRKGALSQDAGVRMFVPASRESLEPPSLPPFVAKYGDSVVFHVSRICHGFVTS